jgi:hypothetical protein
MSLGRPERGGDVHDRAVEELRAAQDDQSRLRRAAYMKRGTRDQDTADDQLSEAGDRLAAREAWLTWVERGF